MNLPQFAIDFCTKPIGSIVPAFHSGENVDGVAKYVLFREPPFQVELIIFWPGGMEVLDHKHPNVDTIQVLLSGDVKFSLDGKLVPWKPLDKAIEHGPACQLLKRTVTIPADQLHSAKSKRLGAAWLSFEQWKDSGCISTTVEDWEGPAFGPQHQNIIQK